MCHHEKVKCLSCGAEGSPAQLLGQRTSEKKAAAAKINGNVPKKPRKPKASTPVPL